MPASSERPDDTTPPEAPTRYAYHYGKPRRSRLLFALLITALVVVAAAGLILLLSTLN